MDKREIICIVCPIGCHMELVQDRGVEAGYRVYGAQCKRGRVYGVKEVTRPTRLLTTTVEIQGADLPRLPVRSARELAKDKILEAISLIKKIKVKAPIKMGDVLLENILDTGVDIIASRDLTEAREEKIYG